MKREEQVVALIPVREGSNRVKEKNFREFIDDESLLSLKIKQLKEEDCFNNIYVSSDSKRAKEMALDLGAEFLERPEHLCQAEARWFDVTNNILESVPGNPLATWTMVTAPMFTRYKEGINLFNSKVEEGFNSLLTVEAHKEYYLNEKGRPVNCNFGFWHSYTQELETYYSITGSMYLAQKSDQLKWSYWIGTKPLLFEISRFESVDVDTIEDFEFAKILYENKFKMKK